MKKISFLMTSDTHGYWLNTGAENNFTLLHTASAIQQLRDERQHSVVTIDLGDFIQGSTFATHQYKVKQSGEFFAQAMNSVGYDYQIIGNHEFNYGKDYLLPILEDLKAGILNSNMMNSSNGKPFVGEPYHIINCEGIKIAIIGATTHYIPNWELPAHYQGIEFKDAFETVQHYVNELRPEVDVIVVAYHGGFEKDLDDFSPLEILTGENQGARMLQEIEGIDVLLTGHQHRTINQPVGKTWVVQAGYGGEWIADVTMTIEEKRIIAISGELHDPIDFQINPKIAEPLKGSLDEADAWLNDVIGEAPLTVTTTNELQARVQGHPYIELLNQLQLHETQAQFSAVTLINKYFSQFAGPITNETLLLSYPYYNRIARVTVSGQDLYEIMEYNLEYLILDEQNEITVNPKYLSPKPRHYNFDIYSGFTTHADLSKPFGQRVIQLIDKSNNQPLNKDAQYTLALSQYRAAGGGDYKHFSVDKIDYLSTIDVAGLLTQAIRGEIPVDWNKINENYQNWDFEV